MPGEAQWKGCLKRMALEPWGSDSGCHTPAPSWGIAGVAHDGACVHIMVIFKVYLKNNNKNLKHLTTGTADPIT